MAKAGPPGSGLLCSSLRVRTEAGAVNVGLSRELLATPAPGDTSSVCVCLCVCMCGQEGMLAFIRARVTLGEGSFISKNYHPLVLHAFLGKEFSFISYLNYCITV